ncbi:MAG TPA: EamA family transporter [Anaerolineae bacterium]|nr:EamA family transporter [Anaerolineae bacterium]MCB0176710.1 EamA family transporter [Anaerolineae bacterium]MCB0222483.1 EamA family transporter [Anaerolineae bacterium]MCB9103096.1 EamA family transporter [Anaerolineales bacterium]HRV93414.1 EamA family transporter [Anaerolineae bacterium]
MQKTEVNQRVTGTILLGLVSIMLLSAGQTSLKFGLNAIGGVSLADGVAGMFKLLQTPWIIVGFGLYGLSAVLWLDVLSKLDFSLAFPMVGLTYVFTLLIGRFFFGETIGWERMLGVAFILMGIFFLVRSGSSG